MIHDIGIGLKDRDKLAKIMGHTIATQQVTYRKDEF